MSLGLADAYRLFQDGAEVLSVVERNGIRVDVEYCRSKVEWLESKMEQSRRRLFRSKLGMAWEARYPGKVKPDSGAQLRHILYQDMRIEPFKQTQTGEDGSIDEESLRQVDVDGIDDLLKGRRHKKISDILRSYLKYQVDGLLHPSFGLHTVSTYRSCVAVGTNILVARDFLTHPDGIPIENVRVGDYVYCFDDNLRPAVKRVLWAGKTGHRKVVRLHWVERGNHGIGHLDVTPEHLIRLIDGSYEQAKNLEGADFRKPHESRHLPKIRTLACSRFSDKLRFTGHLCNSNGIEEHRFLYSHLIGYLSDDDVVHHKNGVHLDHSLDNLEKMSLSAHSLLHSKDYLSVEISKMGSDASIARGRREGFPWMKRGDQHPGWINIPRFSFLRLLARVRGKPTDMEIGYELTMSRAKLFGIDVEHIRDRYDRSGNYISLGRLRRMGEIRLGRVRTEFGLNYSKARRMLDKRGVQFVMPGPARNLFGRGGITGNHTITRVEWLNEAVDVYDLEIEDCHNFIANEICVHNSADSPNMQNVPKRDKEMMDICRRAIVPRPGNLILEVDFKGVEVSVACVYHKDPVMQKYLRDPKSNMHGDMARQIFWIPDDFVPQKGDNFGEVLRQSAKNGFVFPEFYGDWYESCAFNIAFTWCKLPRTGSWKKTDGIVFMDDPIGKRMLDNGVKSLDAFSEHMRKIEDDFWNRRFRVYNQWRKRWYEDYQRTGSFEMKTGFRCTGLLDRKQVINFPVQGAAFHCLLKALIEVVRRTSGWKSVVIGEIHDSMLIDCHPDELTRMVRLCHYLCGEWLPRQWDWIDVPMGVEMQVSEIDGSWANMVDVK